MLRQKMMQYFGFALYSLSRKETLSTAFLNWFLNLSLFRHYSHLILEKVPVLKETL